MTVLATSREALAVPDEVQVTVGPRDPAGRCSLGRGAVLPAAQLLADRARAVAPAAVSSDGDLAAVATIARALDGMPLALELAAARTSTLSPSEIAARLGHRFSLLTSGTRTAETRPLTLRPVVDSSYDLLPAEARWVFDDLAPSTVAGVEAAEAVLGDEELSAGEVLDIVGWLVQRSMVVVERGVTTRYRMLETLREYAAERLEAAGGAEALARRHARHYQEVAAGGERLLRTGGQREALRVLREEQPNIRAALAWWDGPSGDRDAVLEMAGSLGLFWHLGRHLEGRDVLRKLLASPTGSRVARARALQALSLVNDPGPAWCTPVRCARPPRPRASRPSKRRGTRLTPHCRRCCSPLKAWPAPTEDATRLCSRRQRRSSLPTRTPGVRLSSGSSVWRSRSSAATRQPWHSGGRQRRHSASSTTPGGSRRLYHLGWGLRQYGRYEDAARVLEEALDGAASAGLWNTVQWALADLGVTQLDLGHLDEAAGLFQRAAEASRRVGDGAGAVPLRLRHRTLSATRG